MKNLAIASHKVNLYQTIHHYLILIHAFQLTILVGISDSTSTHLEQAQRLLSAGKFSDALPHFHEAITSDPSNYLTYFKRATVFLALNRPKSALEDLDKALELNSMFTSALNQRANLHLKLGNLDEAQIDYEKVLSNEPSNHEALTIYNQIDSLRDSIRQANQMLEDEQHDAALRSLNTIIELIPWNAELLRNRASAYERVGQIRRAITDYRNVAKLKVDARTYLDIAKLCYALGSLEESLNAVRDCLKLDPDNKACMKFYKPTKKLNTFITKMIKSRDSKDNDDCHLQGQNAIELIDDSKSQLSQAIQSVMCQCLSRAGDTDDGIKICDEAINSNSEAIENLTVEKPDLLCDKADLLASIEDYSEALKLYQESQKIKSSKRAKQGIEKMNKLKKQKSKRNYYKILGVNRSAGETEINKAYRKLAAKWHPDRFKDESGKKKAQAKFMDIADAKSVLTDPEKRRQFDMGDDPLDPESKHGSPHHQGFYPDSFAHFGGGAPFQFKFNFG